MRITNAAGSILLLLTCTLAMAAENHNQLTAEEQAAGWQLLFDGESLDHWRTYRKPAPDLEWQAVDGELRLTRRGGGDLIVQAQTGSGKTGAFGIPLAEAVDTSLDDIQTMTEIAGQLPVLMAGADEDENGNGSDPVGASPDSGSAPC